MENGQVLAVPAGKQHAASAVPFIKPHYISINFNINCSHQLLIVIMTGSYGFISDLDSSCLREQSEVEVHMAAIHY